MKALREAYGNITAEDKEVVKLFAEQNVWAEDYAYYMALKKYHRELPWWEWADTYARYEKAQKEKAHKKKNAVWRVSPVATGDKANAALTGATCRWGQ